MKTTLINAVNYKLSDAELPVRQLEKWCGQAGGMIMKHVLLSNYLFLIVHSKYLRLVTCFLNLNL